MHLGHLKVQAWAYSRATFMAVSQFWQRRSRFAGGFARKASRARCRTIVHIPKGMVRYDGCLPASPSCRPAIGQDAFTGLGHGPPLRGEVLPPQLDEEGAVREPVDVHSCAPQSGWPMRLVLRRAPCPWATG